MSWFCANLPTLHRLALAYAVEAVIYKYLVVHKQMTVDKNKDFAAFWLSFLELEITRSKLLLQTCGSANMYLVLQAVNYHYVRLVFEANNGDGSYQKIKEGFLCPDKFASGITKKLNFSTISEWTGLDKETVRRTCKKAQTQNWIKINAESGITINIEGGAGEPFVALHEQIRPLVERFVNRSVGLI